MKPGKPRPDRQLRDDLIAFAYLMKDPRAESRQVEGDSSSKASLPGAASRAHRELASSSQGVKEAQPLPRPSLRVTLRSEQGRPSLIFHVNGNCVIEG